MRGGRRKGLSTIVSTLLILLLVFVAISLLWVVIRNVIQSGTEQIALGKLTLDLEIENVVVSGSNLNVRVKRNPGDGTFTGLSFIIDDGSNSEVIQVTNVSMGEYALQTFSLDVSSVGMIAGNIQSVEVAPIFTLDSGKEVTGDVKSSYTLTPSGTGMIVNCGNSLIDSGEDCDGTNISSSDNCESVLGITGATGTLSCMSNCSFDVSACSLPSCPNGTIDSGEQCDCGADGICTLAELNDETCSSYLGSGYDGTLGCFQTSCQFDTSGCTSTATCGDGIIQSSNNEECDCGTDGTCTSTELDGETCVSQGYTGGTLDCYSTTTCQFDYSGCTSGVATDWQDGIVSWWNLDSDATDSVGSNDGIVDGATHITSGCQYGGGCYSFDGNDKISTAYSPSGELTVAFWFKTTAGVSPSGDIISFDGDSSSTGYFRFNHSIGRPFLYLNSTNYKLWAPCDAYYDDSWHFLVLHITGQGQGDISNAELIIDGNTISTSYVLNTGVPVGWSTFSMGASAAAGADFIGSLDEVIVWNRALNSTEITDVFSYFS